MARTALTDSLWRDRGSLKIEAEKCESYLKSSDTIKALNTIKLQNKLPLVLCTDNGSPFSLVEVESFLSKNYIIQLKNLADFKRI